MTFLRRRTKSLVKSFFSSQKNASQTFWLRLANLKKKSCSILAESCYGKEATRFRTCPIRFDRIILVWINLLPCWIIHKNELCRAKHTDPLCQIFSKNCFDGKIASKQLKFD